MSEDELQRVLIPKIDRAWHLSEALEASGLTPRHVLLFSSIAASVGNTRQANYTAANVALDALAACLLRCVGCPRFWDGGIE